MRLWRWVTYRIRARPVWLEMELDEAWRSGFSAGYGKGFAHGRRAVLNEIEQEIGGI